MSYNAKNYTEQSGDRTVIGGVLEFKEGARVIGLPPSDIAPASFQKPSEATTVAALKDDFNTLLANLKAAGFVSDSN